MDSYLAEQLLGYPLFIRARTTDGSYLAIDEDGELTIKPYDVGVMPWSLESAFNIKVPEVEVNQPESMKDYVIVGTHPKTNKKFYLSSNPANNKVQLENYTPGDFASPSRRWVITDDGTFAQTHPQDPGSIRYLSILSGKPYMTADAYIAETFEPYLPDKPEFSKKKKEIEKYETYRTAKSWAPWVIIGVLILIIVILAFVKYWKMWKNI